MIWRKWIVRAVVYGISGFCGLGGLVYLRWTDPVAVRAQVMAKLGKIFPGAVISVDSAQLRLLGGIELTDLRLMRKDDPEHHEFLHAPRATIYHDKEKILDGELAIRQMDLHRLRLRVRREQDGRWNVQGLTDKIDLTKALPIIVIKEGTLVFEDYKGGIKTPPLEVNDISLTLINDQLPTVTIKGSANSELLGKLHWQGDWERASGAVALGFQANDLPLTHSLLLRAAGGSGGMLAGLVLDARADLRGQLALRPGRPVPVSYEVQCEVRQGKVQHPQLPLPLEELTARLTCTDGAVRLERLGARSGAAELSLSGTGRLPALDQEFEAQLDVKHLSLCQEMCDRLPEKLRNLHNLFKPQGPTALHIACARRAGQWVGLRSGQPSRVSLRPEGMTMAFVKFPYPVERLTGAIDFNLLDRRVQVDVTGYAGKRPVLIQGHWIGEGAQVDTSFDITASDVVIDTKLLAALPTSPTDTHTLARSFRAQGKLDVKAHVRHEPGTPKEDYRNEYHVRFHDTSICWDVFPYPLEDVTGVLDIYPRHWEFHDFKGKHHGGNVVVNGHGSPRLHPGTGERNFAVFVKITGENVAMDEELAQALRPLPALAQGWETFRPSGRLNFTATINRPSPLPEELSVRVDAEGCAVEPRFFAYALKDLRGQFEYHQRRLTMAGVQARHGAALLELVRGTLDLHGAGERHGGGYYADVQVRARDLVLDEELAQALPRKLQPAARSIKVQQPVQLETQLILWQPPEPARPPDVYWDGKLFLRDVAMTVGLPLQHVSGVLACNGRHDGQQLLGVKGNAQLERVTLFGQPFTGVQAPFTVYKEAPDLLVLGLRAPVFGGDIAGQVCVYLHHTPRYELNLTASQIDLQEFGRHNLGPRTQLQGQANAQLYLLGEGTGLDGLKGSGTLDVEGGRIGKDLPLLLDLIKFLGLHWPDRTAFEDLHAKLSVLGRRVTVEQLDLLGNAVSLAGKGKFNLDDKEIHLDFVPTWGRLEQFLPPAVRPVPPAISKNLLTIEVRGKVGGGPESLHFHKRFVPIVVEPLTVLRDRVLGTAEKRN